MIYIFFLSPGAKAKCSECISQFMAKLSTDSKAQPSQPTTVDPNATLQCSRCQQTLSLASFSRRQQHKGPGQAKCKDCAVPPTAKTNTIDSSSQATTSAFTEVVDVEMQ